MSKRRILVHVSGSWVLDQWAGPAAIWRRECGPGVDYCVLWPLASRGEIITNIGFIADTRGVAAEGWEQTGLVRDLVTWSRSQINWEYEVTTRGAQTHSPPKSQRHGPGLGNWLGLKQFVFFVKSYEGKEHLVQLWVCSSSDGIGPAFGYGHNRFR